MSLARQSMTRKDQLRSGSVICRSMRTSTAWTARRRPRLGDLSCSHEDVSTRSCCCSADPERLICRLSSQSIALLDPTDHVDSRFLYYYLLQSPTYPDASWRQISIRFDSSGHLYHADVRRPSDSSFRTPARQRAIADVLGALDDKIAANEQVLSLLDGRRRPHTMTRASRGDMRAADVFGRIRQRTRFYQGMHRERAGWSLESANSTRASDPQPSTTTSTWPTSTSPDPETCFSRGLVRSTVCRWFRPRRSHQPAYLQGDSDRHDTDVAGCAGSATEARRTFVTSPPTRPPPMGHIQRRHLEELVPVPSPARWRDLIP